MTRRATPAALAAMFGHVEEEAFTYPQIEAQRDLLLQLLNKETHKFTRGDFVRYFGPSGPLRREAKAAMAIMFWSYLDMASASDARRVAEVSTNELMQLPEMDYMVAYFDGQAIHFDVSSSFLLEPT